MSKLNFAMQNYIEHTSRIDRLVFVVNKNKKIHVWIKIKILLYYILTDSGILLSNNQRQLTDGYQILL